MNWEERQANNIRKGLVYMNKNKSKCPVCDSYLCICQVNLLDWVEVKVPVKNVSPKHNCPHNCINHPDKCLNCYKYNEFKMERIL